MAKKTTPKTPPSAVVIPPPAAVLPADPDMTDVADTTDVIDFIDPAPPEPVGASVMAKMMAGLTRPQALEVLEQQRAHDKALEL